MNVAAIFAGGNGSRMSGQSAGIPKQFLDMDGVPVIIRTIRHFEEHPEIDGIVIACISGWETHLKELLEQYRITKIKAVVIGGRTGQESIRNCLYKARELYADDPNTIVLIHDGVRPLIDADLITRNIQGVRNFGSAITVVPASETIVMLDRNGQLVQVADRASCFMARAPQSFYLLDIIAAHERAIAENVEGLMVDSAMLMTHYGFHLHTVSGSMENIKLTTREDMELCRILLRKQQRHAKRAEMDLGEEAENSAEGKGHESETM